jgi:hypothetical protein
MTFAGETAEPGEALHRLLAWYDPHVLQAVPDTATAQSAGHATVGGRRAAATTASAAAELTRTTINGLDSPDVDPLRTAGLTTRTSNPADAKQAEQPQSAASRSPEKAAHEAARRRRKAAREQREHDAGILKFTLLILASWIGIAALLAILLGWSWPIALVLVLLLMGYVAMRAPDLRETILASSAVVGAAVFVTLGHAGERTAHRPTLRSCKHLYQSVQDSLTDVRIR